MLPVVEVTIHRPHDTIQHVAGAMAVGVVVSDLPPVTLVAEVQDVFQHDAAQVLDGPAPKQEVLVTSGVQPVNDVKSGPNGRGAVALWLDVSTQAHFRNLTVTPDANAAPRP